MSTIKELYPYLRVRDAGAAIDFYKRAFGATEKFRLTEPSGKIGHCELLFGSATLMVSDEYPEYGIHGPKPDSAPALALHLHVDDCDAVIAAVVASGGTVSRPAADHFYGERSGAVRDPFGHEWLIGHELEAVSPAEMQRRYTELMKSS